MIDYTINVGHILTIIAILGSGFAAFVAMRASVNNIKDDMTDMKEELKKLSLVMVQMAVTTNRVDNVERDIRELRHGRGFVTNRQDGVQGEYP